VPVEAQDAGDPGKHGIDGTVPDINSIVTQISAYDPPVPKLGPRIDEDVLDRRAALPRRPAPVTLEGKAVTLVPLDVDRDVEPLHAASDGRPTSWGERRIDSYDPDVAGSGTARSRRGRARTQRPSS
jgi:hypothetical protein